MLQLVVFRHGPAEVRDPSRWPDDTERPLTKTGRQETQDAAEGLRRLGLGTPLVASSPARRAGSTAEILAQVLRDTPSVHFWEELTPGFESSALLRRVGRAARNSRSVVLVGHEPQLGELVGLALTGEAVTVVRLRKAGAAMVSFPEAVVPEGARMEWLLTRKQLRAIGGSR